MIANGWPVIGCALICVFAASAAAEESAPFINTWLVAGTFDNDRANAGFERDWINEQQVQPREGQSAASRTWRYFDDRLFSRNYDDYQDLFSYFRIKRDESVAAKVAYAHVYVRSAAAQPAQLRVGADGEFRAWVNGVLAAASTESKPHRDMVTADVSLPAGWNRLLLKVANQESGRLGFYARLCDASGKPLPGLTFSVNGGEGKVAVSTKPMADAETGDLPVAYREWPYVGANAVTAVSPEWEFYWNLWPLWKPQHALQASSFGLQAEGGTPPYRWSLTRGKLPAGLALTPDGLLRGTISSAARLGDYAFEAKVTDGEGRSAAKPLTITVKERPNRWYEEARLTALIHAPEAMPEGGHARFAEMMKRQGYGIGMVISFNNGDCRCRWPSVFEPGNPDVVANYKQALEAAGLRFGMYLGNLICATNGGENGGILLVEDAVRRYRPAALWFDWASPTPDGYVSLDALYSTVRTLSPDTLIVLNGIGTMYQGDWDVIVLEGWGAWGANHWGMWPFPVPWPKRAPVETWRLVADPEFEYSKGVQPDWQEYLRLQLSLIGAGFVANIDHSPTIAQKIDTLEESHVLQVHRQMMDWADPPRLPPLTESYTQVDPGPLPEAEWGYNTINLARDAIYLHLLANPLGKTGLPHADRMAVGPVKRKVRQVVWMNRNVDLPFAQEGDRLTVELRGVGADPIDTILKLRLDGPHPAAAPTRPTPPAPVPPGNLASHKPARLLGFDGTHPVPASAFAFAQYGVDGQRRTFAQGANEWAWTYEIDLQQVRPLRRLVIHFGPGYATEYKVYLSADGANWQTMAEVTGCEGGTREHTFPPTPACYLRVQSLKPDGPGQVGSQMSIAELEAYE